MSTGTRASAAGPPEDEARGDAAQAVTDLYETHAVGLIRLAVVMLGDRAAAEDVVQEAFCGLYRRWGQLTDTGKALSYARAATLNGCRSELRQRIRAQRRGGPALDASDAAALDAASAEQAALLGEEHQQVLSALRRLPDRQREALVLRFYLDQTEPEIAESMGISPGTVKSTTSRAGRAGPADSGGRPMISPGMSTEERLRAATRAAADTVPPGSAPPLRLPAGPEGRRFSPAWFQGGRLRLRRPAALTPLAAAAAVIIVLAAAVAVAHGQLGHRAAAPPGHHESLLAQLPPYYVTQAGDGPLGNATHVQVRATPTGKVLATVRPPRPYTVFSQVSAAGDGHEFVLLASRWRKKLKSGHEDWFTTANKFFLLRFDSHTHVPLLTALPIPLPPVVLGTLTGVALSPSGLKLAVAWHRPRRARTGAEIQVFNLVTGAVKTWDVAGRPADRHPDPRRRAGAVLGGRRDARVPAADRVQRAGPAAGHQRPGRQPPGRQPAGAGLDR